MSVGDLRGTAPVGRLTEFCRTRIAEDKKAAESISKRVGGSKEVRQAARIWSFDAMKIWTPQPDLVCIVGHTWPDEGAYIVRNAPGVTLTRCAALEKLIDSLELSANDGAPPVDEAAIEALCFTASTWRYLPDGTQHPDWQEEWTLIVE